MEKIKTIEEIKKLKNNKIINFDKLQMENTVIEFQGKNNVLFIDSEDQTTIKNSTIVFAGDNSLIYLNKNRHPYILGLWIYNNSVFFMDRDCYLNQILKAIVAEEKNIIIGKNCLFSFGVYCRTTDSHFIYDIKSKERINPGKSIYIGDHVWIGQNTIILKNTKVGSGSIIGANSLISKKFPSNCIGGGNPVKILKKNIIWQSKCAHRFNSQTNLINNEKISNYQFAKESTTDSFSFIEKSLESLCNVEDKIRWIKKNIINNKNKNRFTILCKKNKNLVRIKQSAAKLKFKFNNKNCK